MHPHLSFRIWPVFYPKSSVCSAPGSISSGSNSTSSGASGAGGASPTAGAAGGDPAEAESGDMDSSRQGLGGGSEGCAGLGGGTWEPFLRFLKDATAYKWKVRPQKLRRNIEIWLSPQCSKTTCGLFQSRFKSKNNIIIKNSLIKHL